MTNRTKGCNKDSIPVMEDFYTLQGEGFYGGNAAYFVRLAGCDVGCFWCDVKESWEVKDSQYVTVDSIVEKASKYPSRKVVITGGEPFMHNLTSLTTAFKNAGFDIHAETSGAYPYSGTFDWICLSPKKFKEPLPEFLNRANELKIIIYNKSDFKWAERYSQKTNSSCHLFLQPEWDKAKEMMPLIVDYVKENPKWKVSLQTHKFIDIP